MLLAIAAFAAAAAFSALDDARLRRVAAALFALCLGIALVLWGVEGVERGRIRGRRVTVRRDDHPLAFWGIVVLARLVPGVAMIAAGFWVAAGAGR